MANKIELQVEELMNELLKGSEFELVDVEYILERGSWYLRIFMDKQGGVDLDDCQIMSEKIGDILDEKLPLEESYILEVSSPGIDRVLKKDRDFVRETGKVVDVTLYAPVDGKKNFTGILESRDKNFLKLKEFEPFPSEKVAQVRLHIDF